MTTQYFYLQDSRSYVGNDVVWWALNGYGYTTDILRAQLYTLEEAQARHNTRETDIPWPKDYIDKKLKLVVDVQRIDKKDWLRKSGIVLKKPKRIRRTSGKTRHSCRECGKFVWDYNPYEPAYCKEHSRGNHYG